MMRKTVLILLLLPAMSCFLQGCFIFGIRTHINWTGKEGYAKKYRHYKIRQEQELYLDTTFATYVRALYKNDKNARHDHLQPIQYLLFDKQGKMVSFMIGCDVHTNRLMYANWNYEHRFDVFPTQTMRPTDTLLQLTGLLQTIQDTTGHFIVPAAKYYDYTEIVIFNSALYRASKEMIHTVKRQDKKGSSVRTLYVNSDNELLWSVADTATKRKIRDNYADIQ